MKNRPLLLMAAFGAALSLAVGGCPPNLANNNGDDGDDGATGSARTLSGTLVAPESAKVRARSETSNEGLTYSVLVQAAETLNTYMGDTDANGNFNVNIPATETANTFTVTIMTPDGKPAGPVVFGTGDNQAFTGLQVPQNTSLGTISFPDDPRHSVIAPGSDANFGDDAVDNGVVARIDPNGVPVGVPTFGRGNDAKGTASTETKQQGDRDMDGMIDQFDADDDGDGTIDDLDDDATLVPGLPTGLNINFFMNLKIDDVQATPYFSGDAAGIQKSLKEDTVITFEVQATAALGKNITSAKVISPPAPAPTYLPNTTISFGAGPGTLWSTTSYALAKEDTNHFQEWVTPNDIMNTGDTFTVEINFDDGTTGVYTRMINYVFHSIPKLINVGPPGALAFFNGPKEITFDGTKDLAFEWAPPVDDFGMLMVGVPYKFEVFYFDSTGAQINNIDGAATWPTAITNWNTTGPFLEVPGSSLTTLSGSNTFTMTMPKECFPNTVTLTDGTTKTVSSYKVDIAAQMNGNNAALMVRLKKS